MVPPGITCHKPMPSMLSSICFSYTSRLKWCPWKTPPTNPCPVCSLLKVSLTHPGWNGAYDELLPQNHAQYVLHGMFLLHIQAEIMSTGTSSHKPMSNKRSTGCFSSTSRMKWCLQGTPHTKPCSIHSVWDVSLTHSGEIMSMETSFHKPMPNMRSKGYSSSTSRMKCCLQGTPPTNACPLHPTGCLLNIQALMVPKGNSPKNLCPIHSLWGVSLTYPRWNVAYRELLPQTNAQ